MGLTNFLSGISKLIIRNFYNIIIILNIFLIHFIYYCFFMPAENQEIYFVTIIGIILGLLLVGFIVTILFLYQRRQQRQEQEMERIKDMYEKEALRSQLEIQENTFKTIAQELHDNIGQMLSVAKLVIIGIAYRKRACCF